MEFPLAEPYREYVARTEARATTQAALRRERAHLKAQ